MREAPPKTLSQRTTLRDERERQNNEPEVTDPTLMESCVDVESNNSIRAVNTTLQAGRQDRYRWRLGAQDAPAEAVIPTREFSGDPATHTRKGSPNGGPPEDAARRAAPPGYLVGELCL